MQQVSGVYTSSCLDTDDLKIALWGQNLSGAFEKRATGSLEHLSFRQLNLLLY